MGKTFSKASAGTFVLNKSEPIHRWYKYLEGYSSCLVDTIIRDIGIENIHSIYDPFGGTGTTLLVASNYGFKSYYSETNPFMRTVIEAKVNCVKRLRLSGVKSVYLKKFVTEIENYHFRFHFESAEWDGFEKYFDSEVLYLLKDLIAAVDSISDADSKSIASVLLAAVLVRSSKTIRQGDLRFAKASEKDDSDRDIVGNFLTKLQEAIDDIDSDTCPTISETICLSDDARCNDAESLVDCVITSPPYLNGTNYIRNTKLELKMSGFVSDEKDLADFHSKGIIAGINNVSKRNMGFSTPICAEKYIAQLEPVAYDKRIPLMVSGYFHDMEIVIDRLAHILKDKGCFIMDIGDSQFAGVHIPTHEILTEICESHGFVLIDQDVLRERRSKNGMILSQRLLKFQLKKCSTEQEVFFSQAQSFIEHMPYHNEPFSGRNWGHPWHSLCSYHGKLKPAIAHFLVEQFTNSGDVVLDPLCGVGTIPLEACLQGRIGIGNDLSEMAYVVTKAKVDRPLESECTQVINALASFIESNCTEAWVDDEIAKYLDFGYNGKIEEYFHKDTFREILCARRYFMDRLSTLSSSEAMVFSCLLHVLHGNRPYALSRNSHPLTPYAPTGDFVYKNVIEHVIEKLQLVYKKGEFDNYVLGKSIWGNYESLSACGLQADAIICSPPFADSIKFYMQNWMRLWLCGWESSNYKEAESLFLDQKQRKNFDVYITFFEVCASILKPNGKVILHLGKTDKVDMADELAKRAAPFFIEIYRGSENVSQIEKHGIKDKGATVEHQYLFLMKK